MKKIINRTTLLLSLFHIWAIFAFADGNAGKAKLSIEAFDIKAGGEAEMLINMSNPDDDITLVQFDLSLPQGLSVKKTGGEYDIDIAGRTTYKNHSLDANEIGSVVRFLLSSTKNSLISGTSGAIISVKLVASSSFNGGDVKLKDILLVNPDGVTESKPSNYTYTITKKSDTTEPTSISLPSSISVNVGASKTVSYTLSPTNATTTVTWKSEDTTIATVSSSGIVKGIKAGTTKVWATTSNGKTDYCNITVENNVIEPTSISLPSLKTVKVGDSFTMSYTLNPSNATTTLTWTSDDSSIATVSSSGVVKGVKAGSTYINVKTANGKTDYCKVTVENNVIEPTSISLPSSKTVKVGESFTMSYTLNPSNASTTLTWTSDDSSIATVSSSGVVKGVKAGSTYINVKTANGKTASCKVTVEDGALEIVKSVSAGGRHSLIVKTDGSLWACGDNGDGQLGDGTTTDRCTSVKIMDGVASVSAGGSHSLIVKTDGSLWACGSNEYGQFGGGTAKESHTPVKIMDGVAAVSADYHSLIVKTDGSLWACGRNGDGRIGDGTTLKERYPPVKIMDGVASVSTGFSHSLIVKTDGSLWACGDNGDGQLGDGTTIDRYTPVKIMDGVASVSAGFSHSLIVKTDGSLWSCGSNRYGWLGDGTTTDRYTSVKIMEGTITEPTKIAISSTGYATFYDSKSAYTLPNGLSAQVVTDCSNNKLTYKTIADGSVSGVIPKGTAVMLVSDNKNAGTFTLTASESTVSYSGTNYLHGSDESTTTSTGGSNYYYKLTYGNPETDYNNIFGWYWGAQNGDAFQIEGHKAWLAIPKSAVTRSAFGIDATDIEVVDAEQGENKYYDLQGRRINTPTTSGMYIVNGKKVYIKK